MKTGSSCFALLMVLVMLLAACVPQPTATPASTPPTPTPQPKPDLYLNLVWHQHQPFYAVDPATGLVSAPWVRLHASKDYVDMASLLEKYPRIHATFNLTPSLIQQIDAFNNGTRDLAWEMTLVPADQLTADQKTYLLQRFFDTNDKIITRFPRYVELQKLRGGADADQIAKAILSWTPRDFRDLQVLFNLAWTDLDYLNQPPLAGLVAKGKDFTEADKQTVLNVQANLVAQVIPEHKKLQDSGQIEITFTPYAHPILPLLIDSNLASVAVPNIKLPTQFAHGDDAIQQIQRGIRLYQDHFGKPPKGMWPAEGAVAQMMIGMVARAGIQWMLTDEGILSHSLSLDFTRTAEGVPANAVALYRPYSASLDGENVTVFFRDAQLSNKVSFDYSKLTAQAAVNDFMSRLHAIRDAVKNQSAGPYVVTVILDGENAWEWYNNDGKDFLNGLYSALSSDTTIQTVTPSEFLGLYTQTPEVIPNLWAGSWDNATFETWIGEDEENRAWDYLGTTRDVLQTYLIGAKKGTLQPASLEKAYQAMLAAEGSDWFWWFGSDKDSGNDSAFDTQYRETLGQVYDALQLPRPAYLSVPIILPTPLEPKVALQGTFTPSIDGRMTTRSEWMNAGTFSFEGNITALQFGFDKDHLFLRESVVNLPESTDLYLKVPALSDGMPFSAAGQALGFYATHRLHMDRSASGQIEVSLQAWDAKSASWSAIRDSAFQAKAGEGNIEFAVPLVDLYPTLDAGDSILFRAATAADLLPAQGPGRMLLPDLGRTTWVVDAKDPSNDDHGPGNYTYPTDGVFKPGVFDLIDFKVGYDENNLVFQAQMNGPVENPWGAPNGLSIQKVDIYIDTDGPAQGARLLRNGRNAALSADHAWDYALDVAGWNFGFFTSAAPEAASTSVPLTILTDPGKNLIIAKIPRTAIPGDPTRWAYAVGILSNDGYGINGVRDVTGSGGQWAVGGAASDKNHTRILDYLWPQGKTPTQEQMLSNYPPNQADPASLKPEDFPQLEMLNP